MQVAFEELYSHGRSSEGHNRFLYSVGESQVRTLLQKEIALVEGGARLEIVALEEDISMSLSAGVNVKGFVDRIDRLDGVLRVTDYKTGRVLDEEIAVSRADLDDGKPMPRKWLQLMCYALIYNHQHPSDEAIVAGIHPLGNFQSGVRMATIDGSEKIFPPDLEDFRQRLESLTAEIMDPSLNFEVPEKPIGCGYCPAASFCQMKV